MGRMKKTRWEDNEISPSKYRSPTRYAESQSTDYRDKDELIWTKDDCDLSDSQIDVFLQCTKHLPVDIALSILRDYDHDIKLAVEKCNGVEVIPDLSLLEQKVLLAAVPIPYSGLGVKGKSALAAEKHVLKLLPHVPPPTIRNYYNHIGRDGCVAPRGWLPKVGHILQPSHARLMKAGLISEDEDSPLYEKPGKRVLRSSTITPELNSVPRKIGKGNNLAIAMVGFDQNKTGEESPERRFTRTLPVNRFVRSASPESRVVSVSVDRGADNERMSRDALPKRGRGRPRKNPLPILTPDSSRPSSPSIFAPLRSPLGPSSRPSSPSQIPSSASSSRNGSPVQGRKKNRLDIDMNWSPIENGVRERRPSAIMKDGNAFWIKREKDDSNGKEVPSTSRIPGSSERNGWRMSLTSSSSAFASSPNRRMTRSSSVFSESLSDSELNGREYSPPKRSRNKLQIEMVGWNQKPLSPTRDRDGFVIPPLPRSPLKSPTRSRQPTPSPPASPEI